MEAETRTQRAFRKGVWISTAVCALLLVALSQTRPGRWLEDGAYDARVRLTVQPAKADPRIVIIDVDNASLDALQDKLGRWPWPRRVWTEVVRYASRGKPAAIAIDAVFNGVDSDAVDDDFASVLQSSGNVVLGFSFLATTVERVGAPASASRALLETQARPLGPGVRYPEDKFEPHLPLEKLTRAAAGIGSVNISADDDATIRREPLQFLYGSHAYPSLGLRTVQIASGRADAYVFHARAGLFDSNYLLHDGKRIPLDSQGRLLLLWRGAALTTYPRLPVWEVICSIYREQCPGAEHYYPPEFFHGKIVLIGASAAGSYEARPMPLDPQAPGFFGHATTIDNLLQGAGMREFPSWFTMLLIAGLALSGGLLPLRVRSILRGGLVVLAILALYLGASLLAFRGPHWVFPIAAPSLALVLSFGGSNAARFVTTGRELRQTRGMLERYIAPQLVKYVMSNLDNLHLNGEKRELTILMSDVRNFTTMTEKSEPMELIALLDEYLAAMTEIIFKHNGIVDKFIGDGILAYWGAFTPEANHAQEAAQAALEMIERVRQLNARWEQQGKVPIAIGIGVNTGTVIFGNIGRGKKIEFTVIGDAVNLAARLESLNKEFHTSIIVSEFTRARLGVEARVRALGGVKVKGKTIETTVYELQG